MSCWWRPYERDGHPDHTATAEVCAEVAEVHTLHRFVLDAATRTANPAACWAGGAQTLIDAAVNANRRDPDSRAHVGALEATSWGLHAILTPAGIEINADPHDRSGSARTRGLNVRHLIERACAEVLDRFARATGPHLPAYDAHIVRQHQALTLYIREFHGERDLAAIAACT